MQERICAMSQLIAIYCSFIQRFNLNCSMKLLNERRVLENRKIFKRIVK